MGIGTFGSDKYSAEQVSNAVYGAVESGYRLIDCASVYQNEKEIGAVLGRLFDDQVVKREELFITGKVWNDMHGDGEVIASCKQSLAIWAWITWICTLYTGHFPITMHPAVTEIPEIRIPGRFPQRSL